MMRKFSSVLFVFILGYSVVSSQDSSTQQDAWDASKNYLHVFRSIPSFFEYLLDTLQERPEILEKNDAKMFKRSAQQNGDDVETGTAEVLNDNIDSNFVIARLTSDEVADQSIRVEQMLEEHNNRK